MLSFVLSAFIYVTSFALVLSLLVFFHELGHYSVARLFGVAVERFSVGFGKPIKQWTAKSGTIWSIGRIPLGGYVKFLGDAGAASNPDTERLKEIESELSKQGRSGKLNDVFHFKPLWQRALVVVAGPVTNFILAIVLFAITALAFGSVERTHVVSSIVTDSAAEAAGVEIGDRIVSLNGKDVTSFKTLVTYVAVRSGEELDAKIIRDGEIIEFPITPRKTVRKDALGGDSELGTLGVQLTNTFTEVKNYNPVSALSYGYDELVSTVGTTGVYIGRIFQGKENGTAFGGPVRILTVVGKSMDQILKADDSFAGKLKSSIYALLTLSAMISIGLGVANLMPIPALDGGHLLYYGYEAIAGRPLSEQKQEYGFRIGFAVIATLFIYLTINDFGYVRSFAS